MLIPYIVDVPMSRWPISNYVIIVLTCICSLSVVFAEGDSSLVDSLILRGWSVNGLLGHMLLHAGLFHLIGNMIFLWVFGNAICAKLGNGWYPLAYVGLGIAAGSIHIVFDGDPAIGASGAINGIVGMFLVLYPLNDISCLYGFFLRFGSFTVSSFWIILLWLVFDILAVVLGMDGAAYWAHLGGLGAGVVLALVLVYTESLRMESYERSLIDIVRGGN